MTRSKPSPYARFAADDLTLRDLLAVDRTVVANERTLLGFVRTSLALMVTGVSLVHFFESNPLNYAGIFVAASAIPLLAVGLFHFFRRRAGLRPLMDKVPL